MFHNAHFYKHKIEINTQNIQRLKKFLFIFSQNK